MTSAVETPAIDALLRRPAFDTAGPVPEFAPAVEECLRILRERFPQYDDFLSSRAEGEQLPALFLPVLKSFRFDLPESMRVAVQLTSSGTTGTPSVVPLDEDNLRRRVAAMDCAYRELGIVSGPISAIGFLMDPATTQMAGSVVIDAVLRANPDVQSVQYLARMGENGPEFDRETAVASVSELTQAGPILAVGYPALIAAAIAELKTAGVSRLPLPEGSLILTGGGWKSFLPGVQLDRQEFRRLASDFFALPMSAIRDMFGMSECPAVFVQCASGSYHVPAFARAQAIDPETGADMPAGETGLLQLTVPLTTSYPLLKILATDKVAIRLDCPCGLPAPMMIPRGRVTAARFDTCAMKIGQAVA